MLFSSFSFLFWFLPCALLFYFLPLLWCRQGNTRLLAYQNTVLLAVSLLFYAWGEPRYVLLMLLTTVLNALAAAAIPRVKHRAVPLVLAVSADIALLLFFKYPPLLGLPAPALPLGISFYTFQAISYVADVYTGRAAPAKNPLYVGLYISLFPQLVAGPIVRYADVEERLRSRRHSVAGVAEGSTRFAVGLAKKVLLADAAGALFETFGAGGSDTAVGAWLTILGFAFQLYFDFSGYSDMAVGLGRIFGFSFPENFNYPYVARGVRDFWRRWHITLSSFFREYVYFPLGGSRARTLRTVRNLLIVWSLTGLWHGASLNFLFWGLYYFVLLVLERYLLSRLPLRLPGVLAVPLTFAVTLVGWSLFAFDGSTQALTLTRLPAFWATLVGLGQGGLAMGSDLYDLVRVLPLLALCAVGATPLPRRLWRTLCGKRSAPVFRALLTPLLLLLSLAALAQSAYHPFLYFRF